MTVITRALGYYKDETGRIVLSLGMIVVMTLSSVLMAYPAAILVDTVFGDKGVTGLLSGWFVATAPASMVGRIVTLAVVMLVLGLTQQVMSMFQTLLNIRIGYGGLMRVRCDLFRKLQHLSLAYHKSQPQGDAIYRLSWDTYGVQNVVQGFIQTVLLNVFTLIFMLVVMLNNSVKLTIVAMAVAPLLFWVTRLYGKILQSKATEAKEVESHLTTTIQRSASSIGLVQAFGREGDEYAKFETNVNESVSAYLRLHWQEVLFWLCIGSLLAVGTAAVIGYGGYLVYVDQYLNKVGGDGFTAGKLLIFSACSPSSTRRCKSSAARAVCWRRAWPDATACSKCSTATRSSRTPRTPLPCRSSPARLGSTTSSSATGPTAKCSMASVARSSRARWSRSSAKAASVRRRC